MSFSADWVEAIGTWVAAILVAVSVPFLWMQIRDLRRGINGTTNHIIYQTIIDIDKFFAENPHLRPYFYSGQDIDGLNSVERDQVLVVAEMLADCFDDAYQQQTIMSALVVDSFKEYVRGVYLTSPVLRRFIRSYQQWYVKDFIDLFHDVDSSADTPTGDTRTHSVSASPTPLLSSVGVFLLGGVAGLLISGMRQGIRRVRRHHPDGG